MLVKMTSQRKLPLILTFVFLMLAIIGFSFYQNTISLQQALVWEKKVQQTSVRLENTLTQMLDAEAEMRGFIITGNSTYLDNYERRKNAVNSNITELRGLLSTSPQQVTELETLTGTMSKFWDVSQQKIERRKLGGYDIATQEMSMHETKVLIDQSRSSVERMRAFENTWLQSRNTQFDNRLTWAIRILVIASVAGILALIFANLLVSREERRRAKAEIALTLANVDLEKKIEERTSELTYANEELREVAHERSLLLSNEQKARREAEIANRLRDEFMATVSHELRTPLNSILGWARLMKNGTLSEEQTTKALKTIIKNSETQNRLIEDLLDVARLISGKLELDLKPLIVKDVVFDAIEMVRPDASEKNIVINFNISDDCETAEVLADQSRLGQVFTNLLTNAIKFSSQNDRVDVLLETCSDKLDIKVSDSGIGISPEFLPMVFERFRQDVTTVSNKSGLGLGLAIVRNLVEMHGGSVRAYSEGENKGATFIISLPLYFR